MKIHHANFAGITLALYHARGWMFICVRAGSARSGVGVAAEINLANRKWPWTMLRLSLVG